MTLKFSGPHSRPLWAHGHLPYYQKIKSARVISMVPPPLPPPIPSNIASLTGPPLLGAMLNWWLFGILTVQVYIYRLWFPGDKIFWKLLVYGIFFVEITQTMLTTGDIFHWFAFGYGNIETLADPFISPIDSPLMDTFMGFIVQTFFCWRIWMLSRSLLLCGLIFAVTLISVAGGIDTSVQTIIIGNFADEHDIRLRVAFTLWLTATALVDTLIAVSMAYLLLRARTKHRQSDDLIRRIVRLTIETNVVTAGIAIIALVTFLSFPNGNYFVCTGYVIGKVYANTAMVVFNNRHGMAGAGNISSEAALPSTNRRLILSRNELNLSSQPQDTFSCARELSLTHEFEAKVFHISETSGGDVDGHEPSLVRSDPESHPSGAPHSI